MDRKLLGRLGTTIVVLIIAIAGLWSTIRLVGMGSQGRAELKATAPEIFQELQAKAISLGLDLQGGMHMVVEIDATDMTEEEAWDAHRRALEVIRNRIDEFGVEEPIIQPLGEGRILIQLAGIEDPERAKNIVRRTAFLEFKLVALSSRTSELVTVIDEIAKEMREQSAEDEALTDTEEPPLVALGDEARVFGKVAS